MAAVLEQQPLPLLLRPVLLHGAGAAAHLLLALAIAGRLVFAAGSHRGKERAAAVVRGAGFQWCRLAVRTTWALAASDVFLAAYSLVSWYLDLDNPGGSGWGALADQADAMSRAVAWLLLATYLQLDYSSRGEERFPAPLRLWLALFLLLSVLAVAVHAAAALEYKIPVPALSWARDAVSVLAGAVLLVAGFSSERRGAAGGSASEEPLLNGASETAAENDTVDSSMLTGAGFLSVLTFSWLDALFAVGHRKTLDLDDVPDLDHRDSVAGLLPPFKANLEALTGDGSCGQKVTAFKLTRALVRTVWWEIAVTALCVLIYSLAIYVGPYLIVSLVQYLNGDERYASKGKLLVITFIAAKVFECLSQRHWFFGIQRAGIRMRSALVSVVYQKGISLSSTSRQSCSSGEMINIISVDADRIGLFSWYMHEFWLVPLQVSMALFVLYSTLGMASLAALAVTVLVMLATVLPMQMQEKFQGKLMDCKDVRMKATSEILRNMRILKLQGWEMKFLSKIIDLRKTEEPLESGKVLSALATFRVLQEPIYTLPDMISMFIQTKVSLDRIASFLCLEELPMDAVQRLPSGNSDVAIEVSNGCFSWNMSAEVPTLKDLNFQARQGMRVAVCGTVGSGKSSLLSSILGEMPKLSGEVKTCGTMAYVSQSAWIQSGKIKDNILFAKEMDCEKYDRVLESCSLKKDLEILPFGDETVIGERGINLSGGQKQRIQIARALYQDADIYLFDDPFSAVDAHTGTHLFKECLLGALGSKTVVYVTHQIEFLPAADLILVMKGGRIAQAGKYNEILGSGEELMELVGAHQDALTALDVIDVANGGSEAFSSSGASSLSRSLSSAEEKDKQNGKELGKVQSGQLVQEEEREKGRVGFWVYWKYLTLAYVGALVPFVLIAQILFQVLQIASNYWMAWASPVSKDAEPPVSMSRLIYVFVALAGASSLCILVRALFLVTAAYKTATLLFDKMHMSIFRAPMSFFDSTPSGRILNRASADQSEVDTSIAQQMGSVAFSIIQLVGIIVVMSQVAWQVFVVFVPLTMACFWYQRYYIDTARELQRLVGVCKAPIIQHFAESITGSATIRSFGKENEFVSTNSHLVDNFSRPKLYNAAAREWLCFRLDMLSCLTFAFSLIFLISLPTGLIDAAIAGLAVTYGLNLNTLQTSVVWYMCNLENKIISVERILQYINIPEEPPLSMSGDKLPYNWPSEGEIQVHNLHVRYAPQLPFVLKGLTVTFPGAMKTGIVGRTGSGKSTLIQALFRIVDPTIGRILIDGVNICTIGLHDLRCRLSIIPQDPTMFEGTIRSNLDPLGEYNDNQIWEALGNCQLGDEVRRKELKLDSPVIENGENWSVGQRQLVCLGRVILKKTKILVLDEATASVDTATDNLIQKTLRENFSEATVITIAHRITSVLDSDMVLLLHNGVAVERETPAKLLEDKSSMFSKLVAEYTMRATHT
ncbi:ABC transporter C family member 3-like [Lolium rigidum]|uniref:ABC transporter C family member 3-like n=1 Tax=Lolium rigidum TaxID=89674 RepID=UPI001F5C7C46|nr:ABC transporter C family member 3-like [Lolium rigidum]